MATLKTMKKDPKNENWIQKIKRGSLISENSEMKTRAGMIKDTSFNTL